MRRKQTFLEDVNSIEEFKLKLHDDFVNEQLMKSMIYEGNLEVAFSEMNNLDKEKEKRLKERLGEAIRILGKSEDWLMVEFVPECNLYFRGSNENLIAYVDVKLLGKL